MLLLRRLRIVSPSLLILASAVCLSCRYPTGGSQPASAARANEPAYNCWGWVDLPVDGETYSLVILHDVGATGRMKVTVMHGDGCVMIGENSLSIRSLHPVEVQWVLQRDPRDPEWFVGTPPTTFLHGMYAGIYEIDRVTVAGKTVPKIRFGYIANPYRRLADDAAAEAFRASVENGRFPSAIQGALDPIQSERQRRCPSESD